MDIPKRVRRDSKFEEIIEDGRRIIRVTYTSEKGKEEVVYCEPGEKNLSELAATIIRTHYMRGLDM